MARYNGHSNDQTGQGVFIGEGEIEMEDERGVQRADRGSQNGQTSSQAIYNPYYTGRPRTPANGSKSTPIDRQEIIRKIKSAGSRATSPELERPTSRSSGKKRKSPSLEQPPVEGSQTRSGEPAEASQSTEEIGMRIERPRSALHRGDFRERDSSIGVLGNFSPTAAREEQTAVLSTSPVAPWHRDFPAAALYQARQARQPPSAPPGLSRPPLPTRSRAASTVSLASSFVYKPPTSPLVQASRPDTPEPKLDRRSRSPDKDRRHTFSPQSFQKFRSSLDGLGSPQYGQRQRLTPRLDTTFPYQAHQPRRSINALGSVPHSPSGSGRRPSLSDSPLHLAPMVGSYEESILRGRMSTTPSKPLNFVAQIGVLGKGDCKPSLRCPPHATVPFPAVFYSYGVGAKSTTGDQPSPYVGLIDLENNLSSQPASSPEKRRQRIQAACSNEGSRASSHNREEVSPSDAQARNRRRQRRKQRRRSGSPKAPPGGSYRIPQQGQIQVVIKNPNKTAVKLFLIPYDLSDMEPGQKTFIRQRSYSAGPIIDMPLASRKNLGTDRPEAALNSSEDPNERPMLRYLVHLHICCPAKGRFFLYKSIRVVFANRVPDGKEKLRNEIQLPEPRYSAYKAGRDSNVGVGSGVTPRRGSVQESASAGAGASAAEKGIRSTAAMTTTTTGNTDDSTHSPTDAHDLRQWSQQRRLLAQSLPSTEYNPSYAMPPVQPIPFHLPGSSSSVLPTLESRPVSRQMSDGMDVDSEFSTETAYAPAGGRAAFSPFASPTYTAKATTGMRGVIDSPSANTAAASTGDSSGDSSSAHASGLAEPFNFERDTSRERSAAVAMGSGRSELSRRLKDLAFQAQNRRGSES